MTPELNGCVRQVWDNRLYPWQCVPDEADDTLGTVTWARNDDRALDRR